LDLRRLAEPFESPLNAPSNARTAIPVANDEWRGD
jgi:hypothetical protein